MFENFSKKQIIGTPKLTQLYNMYFYMLSSLCVNRFNWKNLPKEIDPAFFETSLLEHGQILFFRDEVLKKYAVMKTNLGGTVDIYNHPNTRFAYANQYIKSLGKENSVIIFDSVSRYPSYEYIHLYAQSLANARMTRDLNVLTKRTPFIVASSDNTRLSAKNFIKMLVDFVPFLEIKSNFDNSISESIKVLDLKSPDIYKDMSSFMREEINDFCNIMGIDSISGAKKERLITDEVLQDSNQCAINRRNFIESRKRACEQINRVFGLDLDVEFVGATFTKETEVQASGNIHNSNK